MGRRIPDHAGIESPLPTAEVFVGKDELNLAEFPICAIADRLRADQKALVFEDKITDVGRGEIVTRQLTITAADPHGFPTAADDEVIVGLVQLSKMSNFESREVFFTRRELVELLGWRDEGKSYDRLEKSFNRWMGVTLYYKNAWWSKKEQCWVNEKFHILENVTLYDRNKPREKRGGLNQRTHLSSFTWNKVIFQSFEAGNLKSLDFDFLKTLDSAIAKRLYRFLDKRFFFNKRQEFDLKELCREHIGLSRTYDASNLKRALRPAILELEKRGFLTVMPEHERLGRVCKGKWRIVFQKARQTKRFAKSKRSAEIPVKAPAKRHLAQLKPNEDTVRNFWESLSHAERKRHEAEALAQASPIEIGVIIRGGPFAALMKKEAFDAYALKRMQRRPR